MVGVWRWPKMGSVFHSYRYIFLISKLFLFASYPVVRYVPDDEPARKRSFRKRFFESVLGKAMTVTDYLIYIVGIAVACLVIYSHHVYSFLNKYAQSIILNFANFTSFYIAMTLMILSRLFYFVLRNRCLRIFVKLDRVDKEVSVK